MFRLIFIWTMVILLEGTLAILVFPAKGVASAAQGEQVMLADTLGDSYATRLAAQAHSTFQSWCIDSNAVQRTFELFIPSDAQKANSKGMDGMGDGIFGYVDSRLRAAWNLVYMSIQRLYGFLFWLPILFPLVFAAAFDGYTIRRIKLITFDISSAPKFGAALQLLVLLVFTPVIYCLCPLSITPLVVPIWFIVLALDLRTLLVHLQRM